MASNKKENNPPDIAEGIPVPPKVEKPAPPQKGPLIYFKRNPEDIVEGVPISPQIDYDDDPLNEYMNIMEDLDKSNDAIAEQNNRRWAQFYITIFVFPMIEAIGKKYNRSLENELIRMVKGNITLMDMLKGPDIASIKEMLNKPQFRFVITMAKNYVNIPDDEIRGVSWWWMDRIKEVRFDIWRMIIAEPNAEEWLGELLVDCANLIRGFV